MAGKHGGKRAGAGRKKTRDVDPGKVKAAEDKIRDHLPRLVDNLFRLADGGYERVEEEWTPDPLPDPAAGQAAADVDDVEAHRHPWEIEPRPPAAAPAPAPALVLTKRKVSYAEPDRAANQYLIDRILGRPNQPIDVDATTGGQPFTILYLPNNGRDGGDPETEAPGPDGDHPAATGPTNDVP